MMMMGEDEQHSFRKVVLFTFCVCVCVCVFNNRVSLLE